MTEKNETRRIIIDITDELYSKLAERAGVTMETFKDRKNPYRLTVEQIKLWLYEDNGLERPLTKDEISKLKRLNAREEKIKQRKEELGIRDNG